MQPLVFTIRPPFVVKIHRCCDCHRFYGFEEGKWVECPYCEIDRRRQLVRDMDRLRRSNAALRGALKRGLRK